MEPSSSVQTYSIVADALSKFHTAPEWIQALWLVMMPVTIVGVAACITREAGQIAALAAQRRALRDMSKGEPIYAIYQAPDERWMLYACGVVHELTNTETEEHEAKFALPSRPLP